MRAAPACSQRQRVRLQACRAIFGPSLDAIAAGWCTDCGVKPIWAQTGTPRSTREVNRVRHERAAFELDHLGSRGHQPRGVSHRLSRLS